MKSLFIRVLCALALLGATGAARAENVALILANSEYDNYPRVKNARALLDLEPFLQDAGFRTIVARDLDSAAIAEAMPDIARQLVRADRFIVLTLGHYARLEDGVWLLATDADKPDGFSVGRQGIPFEALYNLAYARAGDSLIAVSEADSTPDIGWRLRPGYQANGIPQGVSVAYGVPSALSEFLRGGVLTPGAVYGDAARAAPNGVRFFGYIPNGRAFVPAAAAPDESPEGALWNQASSADTVAAYERYLRRYPNGRYASRARNRIDALSETPEDRARAEEDALQLNRDRRRGVQEYLTLLGFDTRGVDGVFGPNTRDAVRRFQASVGAPVTGYLTANQVARIEQQGAARAEELRREAERRRQEQEQRDRDWWQRTGAAGTEQGYRDYLRRYPDGLYSDRAEAELQRIEREKRQVAEAAERRSWDAAVTGGTIASYRQYLSEYPQGRFAAEAEARIESLSDPETPDRVVEAARQEERSMNLDTFRLRMVESQLDALNLEPGEVDGNFTRATRRALRRFQRMNSLPVTGYLTRDTMVRLLISAVQR